jgi:copper chaperone CopZ
MTVIGQNLGKKTLTVYLTALIVGSLLFGLFIDYFLPGNWFLPVLDMMDGHHHGLLPDWLNYGSAVVLTLLLIHSFVQQYNLKRSMKKQKEEQPQFTIDVPALVIGVDGMTCEHCKAKVENGLKSQENITHAVADIENNTVILYGEQIDPDRTGQVVHELGYIYKGKIS